MRIGHPGHTTIQAVEDHGAKNTNRSQVKATIDCHHDRIEAAKERCQSEQIWQNINPFGPLLDNNAVVVVIVNLSAIMHVRISRFSVYTK